MCRTLWPVRPEGCFHLALRSQLVLMSAIWETPERLHLFASWLGAPNPSSCPRLPLKLPHLLGWMERGKEGMGLRAVGRIAGGLGGVREEEQRCMHREQNRIKFQVQVHSSTVDRPLSLWWLEPPRSFLFQYLLSAQTHTYSPCVFVSPSPQPIVATLLSSFQPVLLHSSQRRFSFAPYFTPSPISLLHDCGNLLWPLQVPLKVTQLHFLALL